MKNTIECKVKMRPISSLTVDPESNPRVDYGDIKELARSIEENGLVTPLILHGDKIHAGHRRYQAISKLIEDGVMKETDEVPTIALVDGLSEKELEALHYTTNNGKELSLLEFGFVCDRLADLLMTNREIAERTGKTQAAIGQARRLTTAPDAIKDYIIQGAVSASLVLEMYLELGNWEDVQKAVEKALQAAKEKGKDKATKKDVKKKAKSDAKEEDEEDEEDDPRKALAELEKRCNKIVALSDQLAKMKTVEHSHSYIINEVAYYLSGEKDDVKDIKSAVMARHNPTV